MHEAKTRLSQLVDKVSKGQPFIIARAGTPVARVVAIDSPGPGEQKRLGFLAGEFTVPDDFDHMGQDEIADLFGS